MSSSEQTISLPQLVVLSIIGFLAIRWYFSSRTPAVPGPNGSTVNRISPAAVNQVLEMFPQLDRRTVMWELQKSGGNVAIVTDKVINGRQLETPPQTFQPVMPAAAGSTGARTVPSAPKSLHPDLITKYNLSSKLSASATAPSEEKGKKAAWSANKDERQSNLQRRREEMILAARRKLDEQDKAAAAKS